MGKGDKRSRRGKISAGTYGKSRPKPKGRPLPSKDKPAPSGDAKAPKKRVAKRVATPEKKAEEAKPTAPAAEAPAEEPATETPSEETAAAE